MNISGSFDAEKIFPIIKKQKKYYHIINENSYFYYFSQLQTAKDPFLFSSYYISRYQLWIYLNNTCYGLFIIQNYLKIYFVNIFIFIKKYLLNKSEAKSS